MANQFNVTDLLSMETLRLLINKLQVASFFNTDYNKEFTREFPIGESVRVPLPQRFTIRDGLGYNPQPINRIYTTVNFQSPFGVDFEWDSVEQALFMERGMERVKGEYLEKAAAQMAQEIDSRAALWAKDNTNNIVGVLGTAPSAFSDVGKIRQRMVEKAGWTGKERGLIIDPAINTALVSAAIQYFNPASDISRQYREGSIGRNNGFDWYESMSLYSHTAGTWTSPAVVNVPAQGATSLTVTLTAGDIVTRGDKFEIASVFPVNPMTRRQTNAADEMTFTVLNSFVAVGGDVDVIQISPAIYGPGSQYQNVTALPAAAASITLFPGTSSPNGKVGKVSLALNRDAFALVGVKLENPKAVEVSTQTRDPQTGIAIAFVRAFDPIQRKMVNRFDGMIGFGNLYPDNCAVAWLGA